MTCRSTKRSTTWRRIAKEKGLEADQSYYLINAPKVRGKREVDLVIDPPPDLAIEVENTASSVHQLGIYAALGIPEVWRFDGEELTILALNPTVSTPNRRNAALPTGSHNEDRRVDAQVR